MRRSGGKDFLRAASGVIAFTGTVLGDPAGGFYASQDADVTAEDEGGYFTWTDGELREVLDSQEYEIVQSRLITPRGSMHHDPSKSVLSLNETAVSTAERTGRSVAVVETVLEEAKKKLFARRITRTAPVIDKALYPSLNGMMIAAWFRASLVLDDPALGQTAIKALERIMRERWHGGRVWHADGIAGLLDDYIHLTDALSSGYEATGHHTLLDKAEELMALCKRRSSWTRQRAVSSIPSRRSWAPGSNGSRTSPSPRATRSPSRCC